MKYFLRPRVTAPSLLRLTKFAEIQQKKKNTEKKVAISCFKDSLKKHNLQYSQKNVLSYLESISRKRGGNIISL